MLWSVIDARAEPRGCTSPQTYVYAGSGMRTSENNPSTHSGDKGKRKGRGLWDPGPSLCDGAVYFNNFFAAFSAPPPLFFFPPDFLPLPPEEPLAAFVISFSIPAMLTAPPPFPTSGWLSRSPEAW